MRMLPTYDMRSVHLSGLASGRQTIFMHPRSFMRKGGCFMTFEQVVLLLTLLGGAIYATFEITWKISNGKKK